MKGRLKSLEISLTEFQEKRTKSLVWKYTSSICQNTDARFPTKSCEILTAFSIWDVDLLPAQSSPSFDFYGNDQVSCFGKQFFPHTSNESFLDQWNDFKFEMMEMKKKIATLRNQIPSNKIKFKL